MKKNQLLGIAFVVMCAFSVFVFTTTAFALSFAAAEWLENGNAVAAAKNTVTEGELLFENLENKASFLCSGEFDGTVNAAGADEVTQVLSLTLAAVQSLDEPNATGGIKCSEDGNTCETGTEIWPLNLPWKSDAVLDVEEPTLFFDLILLNANNVGPGYFILCLTGGGLLKVEELCEVESDAAFAEISNAATDVEPLGAIEPESSCGTTATLKVIGLIENNTMNTALIFLTSGAALQVSE